MKKLMIAAAIVCAAALAQAGTVTWGSGVMNTAASANGGWSETTIADAEVDVLVSVYLVDAQTWSDDNLATKSQADLYAWVGDHADTLYNSMHTLDGEDYYPNASITKPQTGKATYYSIITAEYKDTEFNKDMYMAKALTFETGTNGTKNNSNILGGTTGVKNWQAVPEPTSGLLLLLGVAGLALKRRRA